MRARNAEYQPKRFNAVIMRMQDPKTTALVFNSGKVIVTGAKTEKDLRLASRKFAFVIQKIGYPVSSVAAVVSFFSVFGSVLLCLLRFCFACLLSLFVVSLFLLFAPVAPVDSSRICTFAADFFSDKVLGDAHWLFITAVCLREAQFFCPQLLVMPPVEFTNQG